MYYRSFHRNPPKKKNPELPRWYLDRRIEMTGICMHCGGETCKWDDLRYKWSLAHILPKDPIYGFPSIMTHPANCLELCYWNNSCHTNYDNKILLVTQMNCFDIIIERFQEIYPFIAPNERARIPEIFLPYINVDI